METIDKDYIDAKLQAVIEGLNGDESQRKVAQSPNTLANWALAVSIASAAITIMATTLLVMQSRPESPAPIVIYVQPSLSAAPTEIDKPKGTRK